MPRNLTTSEQIEDTARLRRQNALMYATTSPLGTVTVKCPYCLMNGLDNPVDVTRFIDSDGKREHSTTCIKGHTLHFKSIDEWRERRIVAGIQAGG